MPELILRSGKRAGRRISLPAGEVVIGRDDGCRIRLTSSDVSRKHCTLRVDGETIVVIDHGSRNGTYVNDIAISKPTPVQPGDRLRVGPFLFQMPGGTDATTSDDDITGWLTEEGTIAGGPPPGAKNDTTLMPEFEQGTESSEELWVGPPTDEELAQPDEPNDPVISQAAQIIQNYWAAKGSRR